MWVHLCIEHREYFCLIGKVRFVSLRPKVCCSHDSSFAARSGDWDQNPVLALCWLHGHLVIRPLQLTDLVALLCSLSFPGCKMEIMVAPAL